MSRWRRSASNALVASSFGLVAMLLGSSVGCEFVARVDRATIPAGKGGSGGTAGGSSAECAEAMDCPGTDTVCRSRSCTEGVCGFVNAKAGTTTGNDTKGDCLIEVCDGNGAVTTAPDDADKLDDGKDCTTDLCSAGKPQNVNLAAGALCSSNGGKVCDGAGTCVECASAANCPSSVCVANKCVDPKCVDTVKNGSETDVDCGGPDCAGCADGLVCNVASDCASKICIGKVCQIPTCMDSIKNGTETDVDCGGSCKPCGPNLGCMQDSDCVGGSCSGSICLETCSDQLKNGNETDIDCGGPTCNPCPNSKVCSVGTDCESKICTAGKCQTESCGDMVQNGAETGVDCGGGTCPACADGTGCTVGSDCTSNVCTGMVCQVATCTDMTQNGAESDKDCGGGTCPTCALGKACNGNADCTTNICVSNVCVDALCGDGKVTGAETCDDGNASSNDGCSATCTPEMGYTCIGTTPSTCTPICNDNKVVPGEPCDDGNGTSGDGCSATCTVELGYSCMGSPSTCSSLCGDGITILTETCDDGNAFGGDGCSVNCTIEAGFSCMAGTPTTCTPICGDSKVVGFEECDDGNMNSNDGCNATCHVEAGYGCSGIPSVCVPVELEPNNTCADSSGPFTPPFTLNGRISAGDQDYIKINVPAYADLRLETFAPDVGQCTTDSEIDFLAPNCTTLLINDDDDGISTCSLINSTVDPAVRRLPPGTYYALVYYYNHGSTAIPAYKLQVTFNALCGNSVVEASETCDDGNTVDGDTCDPNCKTAGCGNGYKASNEQCDDGNMVNGDGCDNNCTPSGCGNGAIGGAETCDDGNSMSGDGCSATCGLEQGWTCTGTPSVCAFNCGNGTKTGTETCDDGNLNNGDGCSSVCLVEPGYVCNNAMPNVCMLTCGNGAIDGADTCDDGNTNNGDGCSSGCQIEANYNCNGAPSMCVRVEHLCNDGMDNDNDTLVDALDPDCQIPAYFPACTAGQSLWVFKSTNVPLPIPDGNSTGVISQLVAGMTSGTISRAAITYNITHTWDSDVSLYLTPPGSAALMDICSGNGSSGDNFTNTVLDTTCATAITSGTAPFSNCYKPETAFTSLNNTSATGLWKLKAVDTVSTDAGILQTWAMIFCTTP